MVSRGDRQIAKWLVEQGWFNQAQVQKIWEHAQSAGLSMAKALMTGPWLSPEQRAALPNLLRQPTEPRLSVPTEPRLSAPSGAALSGPSGERLVVPRQASSASSDPSNENKQALRLGDYLLLDILGRGAMGAVFNAIHEPSGGMVALKVLLEQEPDLASLKRFDREARALVRIKHPNVVPITDFGESKGRRFLAMPRVEGKSLQARIEAGLQDPNEALDVLHLAELFQGVAEGLVAVHEGQVLHRDIKPANMVLSEDDSRLVLIDFGLTSLLNNGSGSEQGERLTRTGELLGTPAFMAPEQFAAKTSSFELGTPADVWGLAASLYFAIAGRLPFEGSNAVEIHRAIKAGPAPRLDSLRDDVPGWLGQLCAACLVWDPAERPSAAEFAASIAEGLAVPEPGSQGSKLPRSLGLLFALAALIALAAFALRPQSKLIEITPPEGLTREARIEIRGRLSIPGAIELNGVSFLSDPDGRFKVSLELAPGENELRFQHGERRERWTVRRDDTAPIVELDRWSEGALQLDESWQITGLVRDASDCVVRCNGLEARPGNDGRFALGLVFFQEVDEERSLELEVTDAVGLSTKIPCRVRAAAALIQAGEEARLERWSRLLTQEQRELINERWRESCSQSRWDAATVEVLSPLRDRLLWQLASKNQRERAVERVAQRLGARFQLTGIRHYECGGEAHELAVFEHLFSGARFHLIPGGLVAVEWWTNPEMAYVTSFLKALIALDCDAEIIAWCMRAAPYKELQLEITKILGLKIDFSAEETLQEKDRRVAAVRGALAEQSRGLDRVRELARKHLDYFEKKFEVRVLDEYVAPLLVAREEVCESVWRRVRGISDSGTARSPVITTAAILPRWLEDLRKRAPELRLPNPVEWTYACRAGAKTRYFWGEEFRKSADRVWSYESAGLRPQAVGLHAGKGNAFGLEDMLGNVEEFCAPHWDLWRKRCPNPNLENSSLAEMLERWPIGGGSTLWHVGFMRSDLIHYKLPKEEWGYWGLRLAASIP